MNYKEDSHKVMLIIFKITHIVSAIILVWQKNPNVWGYWTFILDLIIPKVQYPGISDAGKTAPWWYTDIYDTGKTEHGNYEN